MLSISSRDMSTVVDTYVSALDTLRPKPLMFSKYMKRVLDEGFAELQPKYPMTIKIPKSNQEMLAGDFSPAYEIVLNEPVTMEDGTPIWFRDSSSEVYLRFGYKNMNGGVLSDEQFSMEYIHAFLGGSSGHGKSVTLNSLLGGICHEYGPWAVNIHMSDAKIVEFKKYGVKHRIPHIKTIAATEEADYVISVLESGYREMNERAKIFGSLGVSNLKSFSKKTGLCLPQVIILMDEVESTFKLAGKKASKIADLIDGYARLGRSAGFHVLMSTQNMSADIPKSAIGQIRTRMCLGANKATSESILANDGATANVGRIGRLIVNTAVMNGGNTKPHNVVYQTPFITDDDFDSMMEFLESKGQEVGFRSSLAFYDEEDIKTAEEFDSIIENVQARMKKRKEVDNRVAKICLGSPAFVTTDVDEMLKIQLDGADIENILVLSVNSDNTKKLLHTIAKNLEPTHEIVNLYNLEEFKTCLVPSAVSMQSRAAKDEPLKYIDTFVSSRQLLLTIDSMLNDISYVREDIEAKLSKEGVPEEFIGNELTLKRYAIYDFMKGSSKHSELVESASTMFSNFARVMGGYKSCNSISDPVTKDKFARKVFFIGQLSGIMGYGRDPKSKFIDLLKRTMADASLVNIAFVLHSRSMEGLQDLNSVIRYILFHQCDTKDWSRCRVDEPTGTSNKLVCLHDTLSSEGLRKFKAVR